MITDLILTGIVTMSDLESTRIIRKTCVALVSFFILIPALLLALIFTATSPRPLKGPFVNDAISAILSERYGEKVEVQNASISRWSWISFENLSIKDQKQNTLIEASGGRIHLKKISLNHWHFAIETEIELKGVLFYKEYYKNFPEFKWYAKFVQKPMDVHTLNLDVIQGPERTILNIRRFDSKIFSILGTLTVDKTKVLQRNIVISYSPLLMLRSIF